jgi:hypothetical protein
MRALAMMHRSAFHLDCTAIFPACRFDCTKCMAEVQSTLAQTPGVAGLHTEGQGADARLIIEHDPAQASPEQLLETLGRLPSFCRASFVPTVLG